MNTLDEADTSVKVFALSFLNIKTFKSIHTCIFLLEIKVSVYVIVFRVIMSQVFVFELFKKTVFDPTL